MRFLAKFLATAALIGTAAWFALAYMLDRGATEWMAERRADGWVADAGEIETRGFPARFETRFQNLDLADPGTGLAVTVPELVLSAETYDPTDVRAVLPRRFVVGTPFERINVQSDQFEASTALDPTPTLGLRRADILLDTLGLSSSAGWTAALQSGRLETRRAGDDPLRQEISFTASGFQPTAEMRRALDPAGLLPPVIDALEIQAGITFDRPWNRFAVEDRRPQITAIRLDRLDALWGAARLEAAGDLTVDAEGRPDGEITLRATNWRDIYQVLINAGVVPDAFTTAIESVLEQLAGLSGRPDTIDAPLSFQSGFTSLGPLPIGPAPDFTIR